MGNARYWLGEGVEYVITIEITRGKPKDVTRKRGGVPRGKACTATSAVHYCCTKAQEGLLFQDLGWANKTGIPETCPFDTYQRESRELGFWPITNWEKQQSQEMWDSKDEIMYYYY